MPSLLEQSVHKAVPKFTATSVDLFCGGGGFTSGLMKAAKRARQRMDHVAVNHWGLAIETHRQNHPETRHFCQRVDAIRPETLFPGGIIDVLLASPECRYFSIARGAKPIDDQLRASPWHVIPWLEAVHVRRLKMENVPEFENWGPLKEKLDSRGRPVLDEKTGLPVMIPDPAKRGETFRAWVAAVEAIGYRVEFRKLCAADYGDATTRERFFLQAEKDGRRITWPTASHTPDTYRTARSIIDWDVPGTLVRGRKKPVADATLARIDVGMRKFCQRTLQPFLVKYYRTGTAVSVDHPLDTVTTHGRFGLVQPVKNGGRTDFLLRMLSAREQQRAMGFDESYRFAGPEKDQIKQIGNAVPVGLATAVCADGLVA